MQKQRGVNLNINRVQTYFLDTNMRNVSEKNKRVMKIKLQLTEKEFCGE